MPAIPASSLVLVTGASGYIAAHVVDTFIKKGYRVRGTVRSTDKGKFLENLFGKDKFEYVIVKDLEDESGFDEAVKGVSGIAHTASPFHLKAKTPKELIDPAVNGTTGVLKAALKNGTDIKRIVVTSSLASILDPKPSGPAKNSPVEGSDGKSFHYTEADWNESSPKIVKEKGEEAGGGPIYLASKTLAEHAAWDFVKENKPSWDLATVLPSLVFGPIIHQVDSPDKLNTSVAAIWSYLKGEKKDSDLTSPQGDWVDVRDVAEAHFLALTVEKAGGERFLTTYGPYTGQDIVDVLHSLPEELDQVPKGKPGSGAAVNAKANDYSRKKSEEVLGLKYTNLDASIKDTYKSVVDKFGDELKK